MVPETENSKNFQEIFWLVTTRVPQLPGFKNFEDSSDIALSSSFKKSGVDGSGSTSHLCIALMVRIICVLP